MINRYLTVILAVIIFALVFIGLIGAIRSAHAQIQPGPNISPGGVPFTYSPRFGYLGPPQPMPPQDAPTQAEPPPAYAPNSPPSAPPPIGWIYGPYTSCADPPRCSTGFVSVQADGLNVRSTPDGIPVMALVNGTPFVPLRRDGNWFLISPACELTPTWAWSWTANVPLNRCWQ
jgi:hypothetical protein